MSASAHLIEEIKQHLANLGHITARRMFSGAGIYCDGLIFAIVIDDTLYLKTAESSRASFAAEGSGPFTYVTKHGKTVATSYYRAPERLLDDADELRSWVSTAIASAQAAAAAKTKRPAGKPAKRKPLKRAR